MDKKRILVADDEHNILLTMQFILEVADYDVTIAENGQEALDKILQAQSSCSPMDLLIMDIQMPCLTGLELIDELNRLGMDIPILVITGYGNKEMVVELMRKGCSDYLDKPIDDEQLLKRVAALLGKKQRKP